MFIEFIFSMNIIGLLLIVTLVVIVAYKVLLKKARPKVRYTPFDYIMGMSNREFKKEEEELKNDDH